MGSDPDLPTAPIDYTEQLRQVSKEAARDIRVAGNTAARLIEHDSHRIVDLIRELRGALVWHIIIIGTLNIITAVLFILLLVFR